MQSENDIADFLPQSDLAERGSIGAELGADEWTVRRREKKLRVAEATDAQADEHR